MKFFIRTFGCQFNQADSASLERLMVEAGHEPAGARREADAVIFNTCSVREHAEERLAQNLRALASAAPGSGRKPVIGLVGCVASLKGETLFEQFPFLDFLAGPDRLHEVPALVERAAREKRPATAGPGARPFFPGPKVKGPAALLPVITGCDNFCAYCVVPLARGREKSLPRTEVIAAAASLASGRTREITLLGQNVNSWRDPDGTVFPDLLLELARLEGLLRLGFLTSHPKDTGPELLEAMAAAPVIYRHLHLPLQSGSNRVLEAMNRRYTREHYREIARRAGSLVPGITLTSDIIVGFPGETEAEFRKTLDLVEEIGFDDLFAFRYSPRPGTAAASMPGEVPDGEARERLARLWEVQDAISLARRRSAVGRAWRVMVQRASAKRPGWLVGRTENGRKTLFPGEPAMVGEIVEVRVVDADRHLLYGEAAGGRTGPPASAKPGPGKVGTGDRPGTGD